MCPFSANLDALNVKSFSEKDRLKIEDRNDIDKYRSEFEEIYA